MHLELPIIVVFFYAEADLDGSGYLLLIFAGIKREWRRTLARGHFNSDVITLMRRGMAVLICSLKWEELIQKGENSKTRVLSCAIPINDLGIYDVVNNVSANLSFNLARANV